MKKSLLFLILALTLTLAFASAEVSLPSSLTAIEASAFEGDLSLRGRVALPNSVKTIGSRAFAGTSVHGLVVPAGATSVEGSVLANTNAAYLYLNGSTTTINGSLSGVQFVFGPAFGSASSQRNFYATETLVTSDGFYYSVTDGSALPLCAVDGATIGSEYTVPKLVNGQPVLSLDAMVDNGCTSLTTIRVPAYLDLPASLEVTPYATMTASAPTTSVASAEVGDSVTWTASLQGAYGNVSYHWTFNTDSSSYEVTTTQPSVTFTLLDNGNLTVTLTATDELGDTATATSAPLPVGGTSVGVVYRALLIGNTYPGTSLALPGCDNDVAGMKSMLSRMTATPYRITTRSNLSASGIEDAILSAFSAATVNDVSLFYFAGHGQNAVGTSYHGALVGTGTTYISVSKLKSILDQVPGKKIVIIDSCHSGQMISRSGQAEPVSKSDLNAFNSNVVSAFSVKSRGANDLANSGYYVITAAHSTEEAVNMGYDADGDGYLDKHFGLFTYSLTQGSGWNMATNKTRSLSADSDGNGEITLFEAYAYARYKAQESNPNQTAQVYPANSSMVVWAK